MEQEKVNKFNDILYKFKGRTYQGSYQNEAYREVKIYNFWTELYERLTMIWMFFQKLFHLLTPLRSIQINFDRLISNIAFCPPDDSYVFNMQYVDSENNQIKGEILLKHFLNNSNQKLVFIYKNKFTKISQYLDCFYTFTEYGNRIACIFISGSLSNQIRRTIVYSHTNAEDIGTILSHLWKMKRKFSSCNIFAYDYSGFGMSNGSPSERNIYADITAAVNELMSRKSLKARDLILFGESIGSAPTIYLASQNKFAGVILQSAFMSGIRIYFPYNGKTLPFDPFPNIDRIPMIQSQTLIIHGTEDMLVHIEHAVAIYESLKYPVEPFWVNGAGHMNVHKHVDYYGRINRFIDFELNPEDEGNSA